ncbi:MAG: molybdopterin-dependent oxidoreductase [Planctomycetota bacterium]|nr:molybdopterin-dependent oxidoreductase [Planctomycetota bacterium]MDP7252128.1 molybdopterin-dependent oxidoreductase [Planctomycetota bacterium]
MKKKLPFEHFSRRDFMKVSGGTAATAGLFQMFPNEFVSAEEVLPSTGKRQLQAQCPYCGVGCGCLVQVEGDTIVGMVPDKAHPTNKGIQCIKGLNANEPVYKDRIEHCLIRKDMSDPLTGHVSETKGRFDESVFRKASYEEGEELVAEKMAAIAKKFGGNSIGLNGSGQLTMEAQWIENLLMKGILTSNSIEANARMCMTSAVTGYFATYGSDTPPTCYDDIEISDFVSFWGHNPREAHPVLFWRVADHKKNTGIATLVSDPRRTGTVTGLEDINPRNSHHFATINGDISYLNAIAHVIINKYPEAVMPEKWLDEKTSGWKEYIEGIKARYSPEQVVERMKIFDRERVTVKDIERIAQLWAEASIKGRKRGKGGVLTFWGIGYNQMLHGQHNTISIVNLHLLTGNVGRPGCGSHSQTGQPNAMSERLMGGLTGRLPFNKPLKNDKWRAWMNTAWRLPPGRLDQTLKEKNPMVLGMLERALKEDLHAMFWMYTTHVHLPDLETLVRPAMTRMFCVVQDIYRHAPNLLYGDVIFPAITWGEWTGGIYVQSERRLYVNDGVGVGRNEKGAPLTEALPDMDLAIDKSKAIARKLGLDADKIMPYKKTLKNKYGQSFYDPEEIFRDILRASKGSDADLTGMLEVEKRDGISPYEQLRRLRGIQWPAPTYEIAKKGGTPRRYLGQEGWEGKPYGDFAKPNGKASFKLCEQNYDTLKETTDKLMAIGEDVGKLVHKKASNKEILAAAQKQKFLIDMPELLIHARDNALVPELPDLDFYEDEDKTLEDATKENKYPFWLGLGIVYEHFHSAKTIRGSTTLKLVPEQYVEVNEDDADRYELEDGEKVRIITRRGSYEGRVSIGTDSIVKPARSEVPEGYIFSPWNLSVADSADPARNKWLVNATSHRAWDPVSGQADYKKLAARIEKI